MRPDLSPYTPGMSPAEIIATVGAQLVLIALPAVTLAWLLRRAGLPGGRTAAAILAGLTVSLLAGPSVLAKVRPDFHNRIVLGGQAEQSQLEEALARHRAALAALREAGVSPQSIIEAKARHAEELEPFLVSRDVARAAHNTRLDLLSLGAAGVFLLLAAPSIAPCSRGARRRTVIGLREDRAIAIRIGLVAAVCSFVVPFGVGLVLGYPLPGAAALGAVFAVGGVSAATSGFVFAAGSVSVLVILGVLTMIAYSNQLFTQGAALIAGLILALTLPTRVVRRWRSPCFRVATATALPAAIALSLVSIDYYPLSQQGGFWIVLVLSGIWSSDGRWFATVIAAKLNRLEESSINGNPWLLATRMLDSGAGIAQILAAIALTAAGTIPDHVLPAAVAGAAVIELTRGARAWMTGLIEFQSRLEQNASDRRDS